MNKTLKNKKRSGIATFFETITTIAIILVLLQTFLEDLSMALSLHKSLIFSIKISAIAFDLFFTFEFLIRFFSAVAKKRGKIYFVCEKGWIDLIASVPLLFLVSGPYFLQSLFGISIAGLLVGSVGAGRTLKVIKAIRVTRILRFIRMLKIFGKIKNVQSPMVQRHITRLSTLIVFSLSFFFITISLLESFDLIPNATETINQKEASIIRQIDEADNFVANGMRKEYLLSIIENNPTIAYFSYNNSPYINKINDLDKTSGEIPKVSSSEIELINQRETALYSIDNSVKDVELVFSQTETLKVQAIRDMVNFVMILFMMMIILIFYSPHFARTVTDPIYVMRKGFEKRDYTLTVKIPKKLEEDDVYMLAKSYNDRWLPAKMRRLSSDSVERPKLSLEDILKDSGLN